MQPVIKPADPGQILTLLTEEEFENPLDVIHELCDEYTIGQTKGYLREATDFTLSESDVYNDPKKRAALLYWRSRMERALEAVYWFMTVYQQMERPEPREMEA